MLNYNNKCKEKIYKYKLQEFLQMLEKFAILINTAPGRLISKNINCLNVIAFIDFKALPRLSTGTNEEKGHASCAL